VWCGCTLPCPRKRRSESFRKEGVRALVSVSVWQLSHRGFHVFVQGKDKILIFRAKVGVGRLLYRVSKTHTRVSAVHARATPKSLQGHAFTHLEVRSFSARAIATTAVSMGAVARGATCLLLAATVQPVAGVVSPLVRNSALRLTPASVPRATARPRLSCPRMQSAWTTAVDEASGATYYYNEQTGESQWESPEQNHGAEIVWRVAGLRGVDAGHTLRSGDERVLSRCVLRQERLTH
jgi:hypothetical protein